MQRVANQAVRKAMGMDCYRMAETGLTDEDLYRAAGWEAMQDVIHRQTLVWLGHVARMPISRLPKQVLVGWVGGQLGRQAGAGILHPRFAQDVVEGAGFSLMDWFRRAQDRKGWRRAVRGCTRSHWRTRNTSGGWTAGGQGSPVGTRGWREAHKAWRRPWAGNRGISIDAWCAERKWRQGTASPTTTTRRTG